MELIFSLAQLPELILGFELKPHNSMVSVGLGGGFSSGLKMGTTVNRDRMWRLGMGDLGRRVDIVRVRVDRESRDGRSGTGP